MKIITNIIGGIGNQFFQYMAGYALAKKLGAELLLDITAFNEYKIRNFELGNFNIELKYATDEEIAELSKKRLFGRTYWGEQKLSFDFRQIKKSAYIRGYFQSEKYFENCKDDVQKLFAFKDLSFIKHPELLEQIQNTNSVSISIRLGDYVGHPLLGGLCTKKYYENCIKYIKEKCPDCTFYVFSDEIERAKEVLGEGNFIYMNTESWQEDLYYAQNCKHNIIANSTFAWLSAYLNKNKEKVVLAPEKWFNDKPKTYKHIVPESWVKIPTK
ncbi:alpha-1,2-fucosyltransferase [bacterium]|nr:alpha-1,2-fucosyltransferase [bacterium]